MLLVFIFKINIFMRLSGFPDFDGNFICIVPKKEVYALGKNMENHVLGFFMKNIVFHIYLGIVENTFTV